MEIDMDLIKTIVNILLFIIPIVFGGLLIKFKRKLNLLTKVMIWLNDAMADDKITEEEWNAGFEALGMFLHDCPSSTDDLYKMMQVQAEMKAAGAAAAEVEDRREKERLEGIFRAKQEEYQRALDLWMHAEARKKQLPQRQLQLYAIYFLLGSLALLIPLYLFFHFT